VNETHVKTTPLVLILDLELSLILVLVPLDGWELTVRFLLLLVAMLLFAECMEFAFLMLLEMPNLKPLLDVFVWMDGEALLAQPSLLLAKANVSMVELVSMMLSDWLPMLILETLLVFVQFLGLEPTANGTRLNGVQLQEVPLDYCLSSLPCW